MDSLKLPGARNPDLRISIFRCSEASTIRKWMLEHHIQVDL